MKYQLRVVDQELESQMAATGAVLLEGPKADGISHNPSRVKRVLQSFARNIATKASNATIAADVGGSDGSIDPETVAQYLQTLERLMVTEDLPAWTPQLRSRTRVRSASTRHFADPCLTVAALNASPVKLLNDLNFLGLLFESLVVRDLRVYMQALGGRLLQYRDSDDLEVDIILEKDDGGWAAIEVKLGVNQIDDGTETLIKFANKIDTKTVALRHSWPWSLLPDTGTDVTMVFMFYLSAYSSHKRSQATPRIGSETS